MRLGAQLALLSTMAMSVVGCYNFVPVATSPLPGHAVRAQVNDEGAGLLTSQLGPGVMELEGLLLNADTQQVSILVQSYVTRRQGTLAASGEAVRLESRHILVLKEKRLERTRSLLLAAALGATTYLAIEVFGPDRRLFEDETPEDPGAPTFRSPRTAGLKIPLPSVFRAP
jgi:hypothetical protein